MDAVDEKPRMKSKSAHWPQRLRACQMAYVYLQYIRKPTIASIVLFYINHAWYRLQIVGSVYTEETFAKKTYYSLT